MPSPSTLDVTLHHQDTTESFDWAAIGEGDSARLHPILSYSLGDMFWAAVAVDNKSPYHSAQPNSLIPRTRHRRPPGSAFQDQNPSLAKTYLDAFLTTVQPCLPILSPAETAVAESPAAQMSMALGAMHRPGGDPVSQYHAVHLLEGALDAIGNVQTDLRTLRLFVLVTLFSLFHCAAGSTWHLHGLTLQVAVALGLHHRPVRRAQHMQTPEDLEKESLFWVAYVLDRLVSISLGRPLGIDDADISVETPASNRDTELLAMLVSIARRASLVYTAKSDRSPQSDMAVLPDTIPNHASPLFQTLAFQLAIWTTRNIHSVQRQAIGGLHDCLATCGTLLVHFQGGMVNHVPMPWTSAYAILHIAVTARAASALCLLRQDVNQDNHGESLGSIEATEALDSVPAQLASLSRTFHGLQELCLLYDQIRTTQATSTTADIFD
ncbi:hypothetical protein F5X68DRAFT_244807 [Plectosphaerella plurivora]|uniref:Xylanolytic transcriptional activator regulatory domain-containing protein n=1 Tax=Plectosphaerella plurivora TaxID=936078 RepID=A0A9P8V6P4_9PEZI|nr:hypothetical protein F5X68DRAFT_244807 [Plectosphaerella plurivora]